MKENNINAIMNNAIISKNKNNLFNEIEIIKQFFQVIKENQILVEKTNQIDLMNKTGINIDIFIIENIFNKYLNTDIIINKKEETNIMKNNMMYSKVYDKLGIILVLFDGNPYTLLELIILGILTHNTMIFNYNGFMYGTNGLLLTFIESILEQNSYNKNMFQQSNCIKSEEYFKNFKTINKTIIIGNNDFINKNLKLCSTDVIISGYKNYDLYIDENIDNNLLNKIVETKENIDIYVNNSLSLQIENALYVEDLNEAISKINYNSANYSSSIFTTNNENASTFIQNIKSKFVMVNSSPTIEQALDIKQENLLIEKIIVMPNIYKNKDKN